MTLPGGTEVIPAEVVVLFEGFIDLKKCPRVARSYDYSRDFALYSMSELGHFAFYAQQMGLLRDKFALAMANEVLTRGFSVPLTEQSEAESLSELNVHHGHAYLLE